MSDYTLTTEEIKLRYSDSRYWGEELDAQFDRWLAEVKAEVWEEGYAAGDADAVSNNRLNSDNPYIPEIGKTPQQIQELRTNVQFLTKLPLKSSQICPCQNERAES